VIEDCADLLRRACAEIQETVALLSHPSPDVLEKSNPHLERAVLLLRGVNAHAQQSPAEITALQLQTTRLNALWKGIRDFHLAWMNQSGALARGYTPRGTSPAVASPHQVSLLG